jgi:hypothetical protein
VKDERMTERSSALTPMEVARYYMGRIALRVDDEHFQELCRTVAYAIDPAQAAYRCAQDYGLSDLASPEEIFRLGSLPSHQG